MNCKCPACGHEYPAEITSTIAGATTINMKISPSEGQLLTPLHVGGMLRSFERLLVSIAKDTGFAARVGIQKLVTEADGTVHLTAMLARNKDVPQ